MTEQQFKSLKKSEVEFFASKANLLMFIDMLRYERGNCIVENYEHDGDFIKIQLSFGWGEPSYRWVSRGFKLKQRE